MPLYPIFFLLVVSLGTALSLFRGPIYGLITYVFIYFNIPSHQWWGGYLPDIRWSFIAATLLTLASLLHFKKLGKIQFGFKSPATYLVLLLILMGAIAPFSYSPTLAWEKVYDFFRYVYIYILIVLIVSDTKKYKLFLYSLFCLFLYLAYQAHFYFKGGRLDGVGLPDASDANMLAALILLIVPFLIQFVIHGSKAEKLFSVIILVPLLNVFIMCGSRGGFLGLFLEVTVLVVLQIRKQNLFKMSLVIFAVIICFWGLMDENYKNRLLGLEESTKRGELEQNSAGRVTIWKEGIKMLHDYPLGTGGGGFMELSPSYLSRDLIERNVGKRASHNTYLLILIEQGPLGLLLYLLLVFSIYLNFVNIKKELQVIVESSNSERDFFEHQLFAAVSSLAGFWLAAFFIDRIYFEGIYLFLTIPLILRTFCSRLVKKS